MNARALIVLLAAVIVGVVVGVATTSWTGAWLYAAAALTVTIVAAIRVPLLEDRPPAARGSSSTKRTVSRGGRSMIRPTLLLVMTAVATGLLAVAFAILTGTGASDLYAAALVGLVAGMALLAWNDRRLERRRPPHR